ncbi:MAG: hypothetical protein WCJ55_06780 [Chloroflexales bacterium]
MSALLYGHTRSVVAARYALNCPESFVRTPLPGWPRAACTGVISPAMSVRFAHDSVGCAKLSRIIE